jgi:hypothetical protein
MAAADGEWVFETPLPTIHNASLALNVILTMPRHLQSQWQDTLRFSA